MRLRRMCWWAISNFMCAVPAKEMFPSVKKGNVRLFLCLIRCHAVKAYGGSVI